MMRQDAFRHTYAHPREHADVVVENADPVQSFLTVR